MWPSAGPVGMFWLSLSISVTMAAIKIFLQSASSAVCLTDRDTCL